MLPGPGPPGAAHGQDGALGGMDRVTAASFDLRVRLGDGNDRGGQGVITPAGEVLTGPFDLPGAHADVTGIHVPPSANGRQSRQLTDLGGQCPHDRHRVGACGHRVAQGGNSPADIAHHGGVGDREPSGFKATRIVGVDLGQGDGAPGVRYELVDGGARWLDRKSVV